MSEAALHRSAQRERPPGGSGAARREPPGVAALFGVPGAAAAAAGASAAAKGSSVATSSAPIAVPPSLVLTPETAGEAEQAGVASDGAAAEAAPRPIGTAAQYLVVNSAPAWRAVASYLRDVSWPEVSPRLTWSEPQFVAATLAAIHDYLHDFEPRALGALLYPHDALAAIDPLRPHDRKTWSPPIGTVLGQLFHDVLAGSVRRMAARYVDAADAQQAAAPGGEPRVALAQLVTSHPMDRFVARGLTARGVASVAPDAAVMTGRRKVPATGLRPVKLTWAGDRDPKLWNFVRAEPADATAEEVAASLFSYARGQLAGDATSFFAYGLAAAPPLFGLPASWAVRFPEARAHAPDAIKRGVVPELAGDTVGARLAAVASSAAGDQIALQQARPGAADPRGAAMSTATLTETFGDCLIQLEYLRRTLTPWELAGDLIGELSYVSHKQHELRTAPADQVASWGPIALAQRDRLYRIAGAVRSVTAAAGSLAAGRRGGAAGALREVLGGLAAAAATSHLAATSERLFAAAEQAQASLSLRSLQANVVDLEAAMDQAHAVAGSDRANRDLAAPYLQTQGDARRLASRAASGGEVSTEELERIQLSAQETALRARLHGLQIQLDQLQRAGDEALAGLIGHIAQFGSSRFRHLHDATQFMHAAAGEITLELAAAQRTARPVADDPSNPTALPPDLLARRAALSRAQARFARLGGDRGLADFLARSARLVRNQQIRAAIVQAGLMIGITILTSGAGGWVAEGLGEGYLAAQGAETVSQLSLGARAAIQVGAAATEITGNAVGQQLTTGGSLGSALVDNAVFTLGTSGTLGAVARDLHAAAAFEKLLAHELAAIGTAEARAAAALTRSARAGRVAAWTAGQAGSITSHTVMGMALGSLVSRLHAAPHAGPAQLDEWLIQGASVALGKLTHAAIGERLPSYARLAQRKDAAHAQRLLADAQQLHALAAAIAHRPGADAALELLRRRKQLLETELAALDELAQQPDAKAHAAPHDGPSPQELSAMRADLQTQLADVHAQGMLDLRWHLLGLHELAPGLWSGTPDQLAAAVREARTAGHRVDLAAGPGDGVRRLIVDGKPIELHERVAAAPASEHDASQRPEAPTVPGRGQDSPARDRASSGHGREPSPADPAAQPATPAGATPAQQALAARLAPDVTAVGDRRYIAPAARLAELHATWKQANGSNASKIHYDAQVNASYFELDVDGQRVRLEAHLAPRIDSFAQIDAGINRIVGRPIVAAEGHRILRALVNRDAAVLAAVGLDDAPRMPRAAGSEFGVGAISDGRVLVIRGEDHAVDWSALPGIEPVGHTHPSIKGNDLPASNDIGSRREVSLEDLVRPTPVPLLVRELILPSVADFLVMAHQGIDGHRVYTPFIVRDGMVMKPGAQDTAPRLEFMIGLPKVVGRLPDGRRVYRSKLEGRVADHSGKPPIETDVWVVEDKPDAPGHLYMAEPREMIRMSGAQGAPATRTQTSALPPGLQKLAGRHGEPAVRWAHETLPEAGVQPLLDALTPAALSTIVDIAASEARVVVDQIGARRVNAALGMGPSGPMHGRQLEALRRQIAPSVLADLLDSAGTNAGRLARVARIADGLEPASARFEPCPIDATSVVIDTNVRIAIDQLVRGIGKQGQKIEKFADLDPNYRNAINALRQTRGLKAYIDPPAGTRPTIETIVGSGVDLRATQLTGAEAMTSEAPANASRTLEVMRGVRTNREHPHYGLVLEELKAAGVGGNKGAIDRSLIADAMFAERTTGDTPKLATADEDVCVGLARRFVTVPRRFSPTSHGGARQWELLLARFPEGHFTVEIRGHKLEVYFHASSSRSPAPS